MVPDLSMLLARKMAEGATFAELHEIIQAFARHGGTKDDAEQIINHMRKQDRPEQEDDLLLDLLDVVTGFCQQKWRVWP